MSVRTSTFLEPGHVLVMVDPEHLFASASTPDRRVVACHPDDEQRVCAAVVLLAVRDILALLARHRV